MLEALREAGFNVEALHHAEAILRHDMSGALGDIEKILLGLRIPVTELVGGGGGEAKLTQRLRHAFADLDWYKRSIVVKKLVDDHEVMSLTHEIDHVKSFGGYLIALEIEWNNKDPFFDRDLENFRRLHADGAISAGVLITRGQSLQAQMRDLIARFAADSHIASFDDLAAHGYRPTVRQRREIERRRDTRHRSFAQAWGDAFVADKFGEATTHWRKLEERVRRGVGNPCPLLLIGIPSSTVIF